DAMLGAAGDGDGELAGQVRVRLVAEEHRRELPHDRRGVEQLVGSQTGDGTPHHIPDVVLSRLERHESDVFEAVPDLRHIANLEPAKLNLLSRADVGESD